MAVFIALLSGISGAAALIAIFGVKTANDALGLLRERYERPGWSMLPFWLGCVRVSLPSPSSGDLWIRGRVVGVVS